MKKILVVLILIAILTAVGCTEDTEKQTTEQTVQGTYSEPSTDNGNDYWNDPLCYSCNWDWEWFTAKSIDYATAPNGHTYAVCTVYIKNNSTELISTYAGDWAFIGNGVAYKHDSVTYSDVITHNNVDIGYGGEFETQFVYLIRDDVTSASLAYIEHDAPPMNRIKYYKTADEIVAESIQERDDFYAALLKDIQSQGYEIESIEHDTVVENSWERQILVFNTEDKEEVLHIFDISLVAFDTLKYSEYHIPDYFTIRVNNDDNEEYQTSKNDVSRFKYKPMKYDEKIFVVFPDGESVSLNELAGSKSWSE